MNNRSNPRSRARRPSSTYPPIACCFLSQANARCFPVSFDSSCHSLRSFCTFSSLVLRGSCQYSFNCQEPAFYVALLKGLQHGRGEIAHGICHARVKAASPQEIDRLSEKLRNI